MIALSVAKLKMFSLESEIFLWIKPKKKKKLFCGKSGSMPTFRSTRKGKKCFLWWAYVCLTTRWSHNIASSSSLRILKTFFVESLDQCRRLEVREKTRNVFFVMSLRLSDHKVVTQHRFLSSFFDFARIFSPFFARISSFKFWEFKE